MTSLPRHIVVTPSYSGKIEHGYPCVTTIGVSVIQLARHRVLAAALQSSPGLPQLWLDDDIQIIEDDIAELFAVQRQTGAGVVSGWYPIRVPEYVTDRRDAETIVNLRKPGGYHGRWSELTACAAGCMLIMPWVWDRFRKDDWLLVYSSAAPDDVTCPPAFIARPSWDRIATTDDYDFSLNVRDLGVRIVAANRVSVDHHGSRVPLDVLDRLLKSERPNSVAWVRNLAAATRSIADIVLIGDRMPAAEFVRDVSLWCVDMGHPVQSPRFLGAQSHGYLITTPSLARYMFFGARTSRRMISYPDARFISPAGSPCRRGRAEPALISERTAL
jgi:hypothetical protein